MLEFMKELRKVWNCCCSVLLFLISFKENFDVINLLLQVVTVGVVGGSDLVKISEQLGKSGLFTLFSEK